MDFAMCPDRHCPVGGRCIRNESSGTRPSERQVWANLRHDPKSGMCAEYQPVERPWYVYRSDNA
jgi:hypothetical protein